MREQPEDDGALERGRCGMRLPLTAEDKARGLRRRCRRKATHPWPHLEGNQELICCACFTRFVREMFDVMRAIAAAREADLAEVKENAKAMFEKLSPLPRGNEAKR